jgi:hypothetical protein
VTATDAIRFLHREAAWCRSRDEHEALCLLLPPILAALNLEPMDYESARGFRQQLKESLDPQKNCGAIQRAA